MLFLAAGGAALAAGIPWDVEKLSAPPRTLEGSAPAEPGVHPVFYEGPAYHGKPTRVFAWYGAPAHRAGRKLPAMVLIHGGGGTAFAEWVRLWNRRGYAAIAMDTCGSVPALPPEAKPYSPEKTRLPDGGPAGWGGFAQIGEAPADQWTYHAVADVILAHSLLRSFPEVDPERIGVTGISWGGYLTGIVAGVDHRFRFAAPVYGCGFLGEDSAWLNEFEKMGHENAARWLQLWDPSQYLPRAPMPMLWVTGTNDFAYPLPSLQKSYRLPKGTRTLAVRVRMPHGHPQGVAPEEIRVMADAVLKNGQPLPRLTGQGDEKGRLWVRFSSPVPIVKAELNYTAASGTWKEREWLTVPAELDLKSRRATASVPPDATAWYLNLTDTRGLVVSSEHLTR